MIRHNPLPFPLVFATTLGLAGVALAAGDEQPLVLTSEHIGLAIDDLEAKLDPQASAAAEAHASAAADPQDEAAETPAEAVKVASAVPAPAAPAAGDDGACPPPANAPAAMTFSTCVEQAIRGGNGLDASTAVCQALLPSAPRW